MPATDGRLCETTSSNRCSYHSPCRSANYDSGTHHPRVQGEVSELESDALRAYGAHETSTDTNGPAPPRERDDSDAIERTISAGRSPRQDRRAQSADERCQCPAWTRYPRRGLHFRVLIEDGRRRVRPIGIRVGSGGAGIARIVEDGHLPGSVARRFGAIENRNHGTMIRFSGGRGTRRGGGFD